MLIYFSSLRSYVDDGTDGWFSAKDRKLALLGSYANDQRYVNYVYHNKIESCGWFMLDSGAVSVRSGRKDVTLEGYIDFIRNIPKDATVPQIIVGFDVIGDPVASMENYKRMKYDYGITDFLPVFHFGSDLKYLDALLEEGFDYIGLGGTALTFVHKKLGLKNFMDWWDSVFFITDNQGQRLRYPEIRFHGFAVTGSKALNMFPWESVDSTAWIKNASVGKLTTPFGDIRISKVRSGECKMQFKRRDPITQDKIVAWIESFGVTLEEVSDDRLLRNALNIEYYLWLQDNHKWEKKKVIKPSFLSFL